MLTWAALADFVITRIAHIAQFGVRTGHAGGRSDGGPSNWGRSGAYPPVVVAPTFVVDGSLASSAGVAARARSELHS